MDNVTNSSDSDLSDDWSIINAKEVPVVSESESIEVLDDDSNNEENEGDIDDYEDDDDDDSDEETYIESDGNNKSNERLVERETLYVSSGSGLPVSRTENVELDNVAIGYCVFPEEFHNVFALTERTVATSELLCSISLVILCTVVSSFMVMSADSLRPNFIDLLVWQSLHDGDKAFIINNPGLVNLQLQERNEFLENKFNHLRLAVKAFEENMISDTALTEFVTDLQKSMQVDSNLNNARKSHENEAFFSTISLAPPKDESSTESIREDIYESVENASVPETLSGDKNGNIVMDGVPLDKVGKGNGNNKPVRLLNNILSLFNTTSETGALLNKASLTLLNCKDKLFTFKKSAYLVHDTKLDVKFNKLINRLVNIETNIDNVVNTFFNNYSKKVYGNIINFDKNLNEYICKNYKVDQNSSVKFNELCSGRGNSNTRDNNRLNNQRRSKKYESYNKQEERLRSDMKKFKPHNKDVHTINLYKTDGDTIGKFKDLKFGHDNVKDKRTDFKVSKNFNKKKFVTKDDTEKVSDKSSEKIKNFNNENDNLGNKEIKKQVSKHYNTRKYSQDKKFKTDPKETLETYGTVNNRDRMNNEDEYSAEKVTDEIKKNKLHKHHKFEADIKKNTNWEENQENLKIVDNVEFKPFISDTDKRVKPSNKYDKLTFKKLKKTTNYEQVNRKDDYRNKDGSSDKKPDEKSSYKDNKNAFKDQFNSFNGKTKNVNSRHKKHKSNHKMTFDDVKLMKEDILNSINDYINELLIEFDSEHDQDGVNNHTSFSDSKLLPGDWFLTLGKKRSEIRDKEKRSDWLFSRAEGRHNLRDLNIDPFDNTFYEKTYWFFRRAWERNRIRF